MSIKGKKRLKRKRSLKNSVFIGESRSPVSEIFGGGRSVRMKLELEGSGFVADQVIALMSKVLGKNQSPESLERDFCPGGLGQGGSFVCSRCGYLFRDILPTFASGVVLCPRCGLALNCGRSSRGLGFFLKSYT